MKLSLQNLRSKLRFEDRRTRIGVIVLLVAVIGAAGYWGVIEFLVYRHKSAAGEALERFDYEEAGERVQRCLALAPNDSSLLLLAAQVERRRGHFEQAHSHLTKAKKRGAPALLVEVEGQLLNVQQGDLAGAAGLVDFCRQQPGGAETALALEALFEGSLRAGNPGLAKWAAEEWLAQRQGKFDQAQGLVWRGRMNMTFQKDTPPPHQDFRAALELAPDHFQARLWLATWLIATETREAIPHLDILRKRRPDDAAVIFQVARMHRYLAEPEEARKLLDELLAGKLGNQAPLLMERARVALDLKKPREAEAILHMARAADRTPNREILLAFADCMRQQDRLDEAKTYLDAVRDLDAKAEKAVKEQKKQ